MLAFVSVGMKRAMKLLIQYPAIYFTPMFTPFIFGPVFTQPCEYKSCFTAVCFRSCYSCAKKKKTMHLSFLHTYFNILLTGIGFCLALLYFDNNLFPLRGRANKNMELTGLYENVKQYKYDFVYISLPVCFLTIIIFHFFDTKTCYCPKICLTFTMREELSMSKVEHREESSMSQVEHREELSMSQVNHREELSMIQVECHEE